MDRLLRNVLIGLSALLLVATLGGGVAAWRLIEHRSEPTPAPPDEAHTVDVLKAYIGATTYAGNFVGMEFPKVRLTAVDGRIISTDFGLIKGGMIMLFKPQSCQPCLVTQLKSLQHLVAAMENQEQLPVYAISAGQGVPLTGFIRAFGLQYPLATDSTGTLFSDRLAKETPIIFLIDSRNRIVAGHRPVAGRPEFSVLFYHELRTKIIEYLGVRMNWEKASFGLEGDIICDVILRKADLSQVSAIMY